MHKHSHLGVPLEFHPLLTQETGEEGDKQKSQSIYFPKHKLQALVTTWIKRKSRKFLIHRALSSLEERGQNPIMSLELLTTILKQQLFGFRSRSWEL